MQARIILFSLSLLAIVACGPKNAQPNVDTPAKQEAVLETVVNETQEAEVPAEFPTLCQETEAVYLNAKLQKVDLDPSSESLYQLSNTDDMLSLCFSNHVSPQFVFRYGEVGNITQEAIATETTPFGTYFRRIGKVTENMVFFNTDDINYYIIESGGMGSGVSLKTFKGDLLSSEYYSGNNEGIDFELSIIDVPLSLLEGQEPPHEEMY